MGAFCKNHITMLINVEQENAIRNMFKEKNWPCLLNVVPADTVTDIIASGFTDVFPNSAESKDTDDDDTAFREIKSEVMSIDNEYSSSRDCQSTSMKREAPKNSEDEFDYNEDETTDDDGDVSEENEGKSFPTGKAGVKKSSLKRSNRKRLKVDNGTKAYKNTARRVKCPLCDLELASKSILKRHCLRRHPDEWFEFECADCPSMFKTQCDHVIAVSCNDKPNSKETVFKRFKPTVESSDTDTCTSESENEPFQISVNENNVLHGRTKRSTSWAVKILKDWITEVGYEAKDFEQWPAEKLDTMLEKFYSSLRTKKGEMYSVSSLAGIRAGLNRYLTHSPHNRILNLMRDKEFIKSNQFVNKKIQKWRQNDDVEHREPLTDADLRKLYESGVFSLEHPKTLQNKVVFEILMHFYLRVKDLRSLKKTDFKLETDANGCLFITMSEAVNDEMLSGQVSDQKACMHEQPSDKNCPVSSFMKYVSKLNPACDSLFQRPKLTPVNEQDSIWYSGMPIGINTLAMMMSRLSQTAGLSMRYTNHCVRATYHRSVQRFGPKNVGIFALTRQNKGQIENPYTDPTEGENWQSEPSCSPNDSNEMNEDTKDITLFQPGSCTTCS